MPTPAAVNTTKPISGGRVAADTAALANAGAVQAVPSSVASSPFRNAPE